jgi:hypothetical protein
MRVGFETFSGVTSKNVSQLLAVLLAADIVAETERPQHKPRALPRPLPQTSVGQCLFHTRCIRPIVLKVPRVDEIQGLGDTHQVLGISASTTSSRRRFSGCLVYASSAPPPLGSECMALVRIERYKHEIETRRFTHDPLRGRDRMQQVYRG